MGSYQFPKYKKASKSMDKLFKAITGTGRKSSLSSSLNRMAKRAARDAEKRRKILQKQLKENQKLLEKQAAILEVQVFENQLEVLTSMHKETPTEWDWKKIANTSPPVKPEEIHNNEEKAQKEYNSYVPSWLDKILFRTKAKLQQLEKNIEIARAKDAETNKNAFEEYNNCYSEWEVMSELGKRIESGDLDGYYDVILYIDPLNDICDIGSSFEFNVIDKDKMDIFFNVNSENIIPSEKKTLTKTGKLSVKNMSKKDYYDVYQDYVCGCVLRIGRELFALLPVSIVIVTATANLFNSATGNNEESPILSVALNREIFCGLNFERLDPSDSLVNFKHNMKFKKTEGFSVVKPLNFSEL